MGLARVAEDVCGNDAIKEAVCLEALTQALEIQALEGKTQALQSVRLLDVALKRYEALSKKKEQLDDLHRKRLT